MNGPFTPSLFLGGLSINGVKTKSCKALVRTWLGTFRISLQPCLAHGVNTFIYL